MRRFNIVEPRSIEDACKILAEDDDVKLISGGTALLILIKHGILFPKTLVNLKKIQGATEITYDPNSGLRMGGLATIYDVESAPAVRQHYPLLAQACHVVANIRIRNMATIGGNLAHADSQSDPPAALVALDASVELTKRDGVRTVKLADFLLGSYDGPGSRRNTYRLAGAVAAVKCQGNLSQVHHSFFGRPPVRGYCGVGAPRQRQR